MERSVLVGVDGSEPGMRAVEWAAGEAARRGWRIVLLTAYTLPAAEAASVWSPDAVKADAVAALRAAERRLRAIAADREVVASVVIDAPAAALLRQARGAAMVVVGLRGRGGFPGMRIGSVAYQVAAHAAVPVVVVGSRTAADAAGEVVVGVDGSRHADRALAAAFETASLSGDRVRAVWAWRAPILPSPAMRPMVYDSEAVRAAQARALDEALEPWTARYPDVAVAREVVEAQPVAAITEAAREARVIVVGARGNQGFARLALGGVAHGLLHHAPVPVMVVHGQ